VARSRTFRTNPSLPPLARAANLAIVLMKTAQSNVTLLNRERTKAGESLLPEGIRSFADLTPENMTGFEITDEQRALIEQHLDVIQYLRVPADRNGDGVTVAVCDKCGRFAFLAFSSPSTKKCSLTLGCAGTPHKATTGQVTEKKVQAASAK
jgi:hypothetical protein